MVKPQITGDENSEQSVRQNQLWEPPISQQGNSSQDTALEHNATRIKNIKKDSTPFPVLTEEALEHLLGKDNLAAQDGEQKYYILPDQLALQELMDNIPAVTSGELNQNRWWRKTEVEVSKEENAKSWSQIEKHLNNIEERMQRIEKIVSEKAFSGEK